MSSDLPSPPPVALDKTRERVITELCEHYAHDALDDRQFEDRLDRAHAARSLQELEALVADLPALHAANSPSALQAPVGEVRDKQTLVAVMGAASRKGSWVPPSKLHVFAIMGGVELDFREARFGPGIVEVEVFAMMGGVEVTVPPGVRVELEGLGIMGAFDDSEVAPGPLDAGAPVVRIGGLALMGGVSVFTRYPGESRREAKKRVRLERREIKHLHRGIRRLDRGD